MRGARARRWSVTGWLGLLLALVFVHRPILGGKVLATRDIFRLFIPESAFLIESYGRGELPLWIPYTRLGEPFAARLYTQAFYPPRLVALLAGAEWSITVEQLMHTVLAATGLYVLCRRLGRTRLAALLAGAAFGFGPMTTTLAAQQNVMGSAAWTGFLLAAAVGLGRSPSWSAVGGLALLTALSFLAGSPETLLWQCLLVLLLALWHGRERLRVAGRLAAAWAWAAVVVAGVALPGAELALHSTRAGGQTDQLAWSVSWWGLLSLGCLNADLPRPPEASAEQNFLRTLFLGTLVCALALGALRRRRASSPATALALGGVGLGLLSLGSHFPPAAMILGLPPLHLFRFPAKYAVGAGFCACALAAYGFDRASALLPCPRGLLRRRWVVLAGGAFAVAVATVVVGHLPVRAGVRTGTAWGGAFLLAAAAACVLARNDRHRARAGLAAVILSELAASQLALGTWGWLDAGEVGRSSHLAAAIPRPFEGRISVSEVRRPGESWEELLATSRDRLLPLRFVEERLFAVEGYGAPEPQRIARLLEAPTPAVYDLLAVSYFVRGDTPPAPDAALVAELPDTARLYRRETALPRAFVVHHARLADDAEALRELRIPSEPLRTSVLLASGRPLDAGPCTGSRAEIVAATGSRLEVVADACAPGYLVVSDAFFAGWTADVDGRPAPLHRANYLLRAVELPAGRHRVTMSYRPLTFTVGALVSLAGLLALAAVLVWRRPR